MVIGILMIVFIVGVIPIAVMLTGDTPTKTLWKSCSKGYKGRLSFDQFLKFYKKKPESWELGSHTVTYRNKHTVAFKTYRDWKRYRRWKKRLSKWQEEDEVERATRMLLREIHEDYMPAPPSIPPTVRRKDREVTKNG